ncbi:MAG: ABC transporter ATP-binding protein [Alphaproteobacteria bacterium]|nr:MAG: ABC transporter ATP-binding protein [Alphaproteobacteria bacterium]
MSVNLEISGISYRYADQNAPAVERLSLSLEAGQLTSLLGPSGCGKSTVLKMIAGLLKPGEGDIRMDGQSVLALPPEKRRTVLMFQEALLFPYMTVAENIGFGLKMQGMPRSERETRVAEMMSLVQLDDLGARKPAALSGGQQQRAALARALVAAPRLLLLDEPFSNLDATLRIEMRSLLQELQQKTEITTLFVTHDQEEAVTLSDTIALMLRGHLIQEGPPDAFYMRPESREVARFFGSLNFIGGRVEAGHFLSALGRFRLPEVYPDGNGELTFRPENVCLQDMPGDPNSFTARLLSKEFMGSQTRLHLVAADCEFHAFTSPETARDLTEGAAIPIFLPPRTLRVLS